MPIDRPLTDREWRARDDARTLAVAEEIKQDKARLSNAKVAASKMLEEQKEETKALSKVAGRQAKGIQAKGIVDRILTNHNVFQKI